MSTLPPPYDRQATFTSFHTEPAPTVGQDLEAEFNSIKQSQDATQARAQEIQRDDGKLANLSVHPDALSSAVRALMSIYDGVIRGAWVTATVYNIRDVIEGPDGVSYIAVTTHIANPTFSVDVSAGRWIAIDSASAYDAGLRNDLSNAANGAGMSGYTPPSGGGATTVKGFLDALWASTGASLVKFIHNGVGAVARILQDKLRERVSAEDFGAVGDGVTDDSAAINAAITAVNAAGGGDVILAPKDYKITAGIVQKEGVHLRGAGIGSTRMLLGGSPTSMIDALGPDLPAGIVLTANATPFAKTLTMTSTATLAAGDYLLLKDEFSYSAQSPPYRAGEVVRIKTVDSGTQVTLWSPVQGSMHAASSFAYTTGNGAIVQKISFIKGCGVSDMTIEGELNTVTIMIRMRYVYAPVIKNVLLKNGGSDGVRLTLCAEAVIDHLVAEDMTDDIPGGHSGYAIHLAEACDGVAISNCHFTRVRHGVTTGSGGGTGVPHRVTISNCTGHYTTQAPFDTHEAGDGIMINGCISVGSGTHGISIRSVNTHVADCLILSPGGGHGITIPENQARNVTLKDNVIRNVLSSGNHGINVSEFVDGLTIQGNQIENCATDAISIHSSSKNVIITDNVINGYGMVAANRNGIIATNSVGSTEKWFVARNLIMTGTGSVAYGIHVTLVGNAYVWDNKALGTFGTAAWATATNIAFRNDVLGEAILTPAQITANQANYSPTGYGANTDMMRISSDAARDISGLQNGHNRRVHTFFNIGAFTITLVHDATSTASNRFLCPNSANYAIRPNGAAQMVYDGTSQRWRVVAA